jgi:D-amino-acid dehydrogenase
MTNDKVLIIGGGVIGAACAEFLSQRGYGVTIIEKGEFGCGASHGNCGLVCPSHVLPLTEPGAWKMALESLFDRHSPFRVQPRLDLRLWSWLWRFARRCNRRDMLAGGAAIQPLLLSSMELYSRFCERGDLVCEWEKQGLLYVYKEKVAFENYAATNRLMTEQFHEPAERFDGEAVREFEPALKPGLAGGWYYEHDAHLRPDVLLKSWRKRLEERGIVIREQAPFKGFVFRDSKPIGVQVNQELLTADAFVIATGALTPLLERELNCMIPIQPGKGYSLTMPRPQICPARPLIFPEYRVAVTPMQTGYRLGSIMEFAGYDASIPPERIELLRRGAEPFLQEPYCEPVIEQWTGWRPMTPDSVPIIGKLPRLENVYLAAGHNMLGLSMAPATGKLVAELVSGEQPHIDPMPYAVTRFT